ncbi:ComEC/Rec2 family competence protein [Sphingomonas sp. CFBP 8760]|uniref:ComEC/Rec2 family competence protein n=1 Tax=Sphingomonas sp. CFBP 8760 TaxID=2775282 RepID=UPI00177CEC54|nr:ComEC/Rec2 family competence protein [Sphingomonas sp. CFBP 8760]MBD8547816.1 ComEC/Rec2 family competence protein [Sphingomonas sp. CFBP 8760]
MAAAIERRLEAERDRLPLGLPVMLGAGVAAWFALPRAAWWSASALALLAFGLAAAALGRGGRSARTLMIGALAMAAGLGLVWLRAERVAAPVLARPAVVEMTARVVRVESLAARDLVRLTLLPGVADLPPRVRVNLATADVPAGIGPGATIRLRARLMPPPEAAVPGAYDYARVAWFTGIGATGRGFAPVVMLTPSRGQSGLRTRLGAHITQRIAGSAGGIASALATGDTGAITQTDADAMRAAGLAHLLSVSGLHITAVVTATMVIVLRLLALVPALALRVRLPLVAAGAGALAAIGYTLLTGAEVPTIRSCVAALLVLVGLALGREAMTLRLVAAGALVVVMVWPEAVAGPSFQLSFAAITAIVALHEHPALRAFAMPRDEAWWRRLARGGALLLATGVVVEAALMPIAAYHFHKAGLYGALANIVAIPWTTFVVMPLEVLALLLDAVGLGGPIWWLVAHAITALLWLARTVAAAPGAVSAVPVMPDGAFALMVIGGLWLALWRTGWRRWGLVPLAVGTIWALTVPLPDLLVTGDGRHAAIRTATEISLLRDRTGDYMRAVLGETGGADGEPGLLSETTTARCTADLCLAAVGRWRVLMTRSIYLVPVDELAAACRTADVVVSERRLPRTCQPRWLRLDRPTLARTGGITVNFARNTIRTVRTADDEHPWRQPPTLMPPRPFRQESRSVRPFRRDGSGYRQSYRRNIPDNLP